MPPLLPFLRLHFKLIVDVQVNGGGNSDSLGYDGDGDRCVDNGISHSLSCGRDEAPEEIISDGRSRCVFVSVVLIYLRLHYHFLIGRNVGWV